jgi:WD40 repeat protein
MAKVTYRIFVSSPGDLGPERRLVDDTVARLNASLQGMSLDVYLSENDLYFAHRGPQEGIPPTRDFDLVVCLLWKRMGTQLLPASFDAADGRKRTGTEFEFETAVDAARRNRTEGGMPRPAVLVYRKTETVRFNADRVDEELAQYRALQAFFERWVRDVNGHYLGYANEFETAQQFSLMFERHLRDWLMLQRQEVVWDVAQRGSPFRGLEVFDRAHEAIYFGRDQCILDARARLKRAASGGFAALWIVGASGSGKSSLLRAGLLPSIERSEGFTRSVVFKPSELGNSLIVGLAARVVQALPELAGGSFRDGEAFARVCVESPVSARTAVETALDDWAAAEAGRRALDRAPATRLIIAIDQAEELLTSRSPSERDQFVALLLALLEGTRAWAVFSFRSDFYAALQRDARLNPLKDRAAQFDLGAPTPVELALMISEPARAAGLVMDVDEEQRSLAVEIAADTGGADSLPMLEFALNALFEQAQSRGEQVLRVADYLNMGRAAGALSTAAERILAQSPVAAQQAFPRVLRELVDLNLQSDNRMPASRACEMAHFSGDADALHLIDALSRPETRLLSLFDLDGKAHCRVSHESLFDRWPRAKEQIQADARRLDARRRLEEDAALWQEAAPADKPQRLLENLPLEEALDLRQHWPLAPMLAEFIDCSQEASRRRERRRKIVSAVIAAAAVIAMWMAIYAQYQRVRAERSEAQATRTLEEAARRSFGLMEDALASDDPAVAYAHLAESLRFRDTPHARLAASYQLQQVAFVPHTSFPDTSLVRAAFSPDGSRVLLTGSRESNVWETHTGRRLLPPLPHEPLGSSRFSSDGSRIIGTNTKGVHVWDAGSGKPVGEWLLQDTERKSPLVRNPRVSDDGSIAMIATGADVAMFDLKNNRPLVRRANVSRRTIAPQLARDGSLVATSPSLETVRLLDATTLQPTGTQPVLPPGSRVVCLAFGPDGSLLIGLNPGRVTIWNPARRSLVEVEGSPPGCRRLVFSPDGEALAAVTSDALEIWRTHDGRRIDRIAQAVPAQSPRARATVEFSPDAMRLVVTHDNNDVHQWLRYPLREIGAPLRHGTKLISARYSPDGTSILSIADDGKSRLWDARNGSATELVVRHGDEVTSMSPSPDGHWLATAATDGTMQIWSLLDGRPSGLRLDLSRGRGTFVQFSPDSSRVLTIDGNGNASLWDRASGKPVGEPFAPGTTVAAYSADGSLIATSDEHGVVTLRNADDLRTVGEPIRHDGAVSRLAFGPGAKSLLVINSDRVALWDLPSRIRRGVIEHGEPTVGVELSPRGDRLVTFDADTLRLWRVADMRRIDDGITVDGTLQSVHFSPDGEHLLTTTDTGVIHLLTDSGVRQATFTAASASTGAVYDSAGARVAIATDDGIELLDAHTLARLGPPLTTRQVLPLTSIAFCPNDRCLLGLNEDASVLIWNLVPTIDAPADAVGETLAVLGGVRINASGRIEVFADSEQVRTYANEILNWNRPELSAVVSWHFAARGERTVSPFSTLTQRSRNRESLEHLLSATGDGDSEEAQRIAAEIYTTAPEHPLIPLAMVTSGLVSEHRPLLIRTGLSRLLATTDAELASRGAQLLQEIDEPAAALNVADHALALDAADARAAAVRAWAQSRQQADPAFTPTAATSAPAAPPPAAAR